MKKNIFLGPVLCLMFITTNLFAAESLLLVITADKKLVPERKVTKLYVAIDEDSDVRELIYEVVSANGKTQERKNYDLEEYIDRDIVLVNEEGRDVVKLHVDTFASHNGGIFTVNYLFNGISGARKSFELDLSSTGDNWEILKGSSNRVITTMHFVANTFFGKVIGIKKIKLR